MVKDSAAHYNCVFFLLLFPLVILVTWAIISFYLGVLGLHVVFCNVLCTVLELLKLCTYAYSVTVHMMLLTVLFGLLFVAALNVLSEVRVLLCVGRPS
jgi:hypothetical protein